MQINKSYMMNFIRQIVGGPKNRFKDDDFNLDLTYITSKIIAMAFPASGIEKVFRNSIDTVADFLQQRHKEKYMIINVSSRQIDEKKLVNVKSFFWQDHKSPPLFLLFRIAKIASQFVSQNDEKVIVVHCNHGKGRTGTMICCLLIYLGAMEDQNQAMHFYAKRRFQVQGMGVTQPCQRQYIKYFNWLLNQPKLYPKPLILTKIVIKGSNELNNMYVKIKNVLSNKYLLSTHKKDSSFFQIEKQKQYTMKFKDNSYVLAGDNTIELKHQSKVGNNHAASFTFNTAFINNENVVIADIKDLAPLSSVKSSTFQQDFSLEIHFKRLCDCKLQLPLSQKCQKCQSILKEQDNKWIEIIEIVNKRKQFLAQKNPIYGSLQSQSQIRLKQKTLLGQQGAKDKQ